MIPRTVAEAVATLTAAAKVYQRDRALPAGQVWIENREAAWITHYASGRTFAAPAHWLMAVAAFREIKRLKEWTEK